jgi:putative FmdB family regulatory protein
VLAAARFDGGTPDVRLPAGVEDLMPTYEYRCKDCGHDLEAQQGFTDDPLTVCPSCGGALKKKFGSVGISFKGSGFYKNDSRGSGSKSSTSSTAESSTSGSSTSSDAKSDSSSSSTAAASSSSSSSSAAASA